MRNKRPVADAVISKDDSVIRTTDSSSDVTSRFIKALTAMIELRRLLSYEVLL